MKIIKIFIVFHKNTLYIFFVKTIFYFKTYMKIIQIVILDIGYFLDSNTRRLVLQM